MLEDKDIQKLKEVLATKEEIKGLKQEIIEAAMEVFATREEIDQRFNEMRQDFSTLQSAVDRYAKRADAYFQEMVALSHQVKRHERWIQQLAEKLGIKLEY